MSDLEIVRLCAEAMDLGCYEVSANKPEHTIRINGSVTSNHYWPLTDDAQAMALISLLSCNGELIFTGTQVMFNSDSCGIEDIYEAVTEHDRRRAICECVAKMQSTVRCVAGR